MNAPHRIFQKTISTLIIALAIYGITTIIKRYSAKHNKNYTQIIDSILLDKPTINYKKTNDTIPYSKNTLKKLNINLNLADTTELKLIYGIGPILAKRIVLYRQQLGGYININQLFEVKGIDKTLVSFLNKNLFIDASLNKKIFINFAPKHKLTSHPYFSVSMANRITKHRKTKGGYKNLKELIDNNILLPKEAHKIASYISFKNVHRNKQNEK